jgi:hypothetical protein
VRLVTLDMDAYAIKYSKKEKAAFAYLQADTLHFTAAL